MENKFADIIIDIAHEKLDRYFVYRIPENLQGQLEEGMEVEVPFGTGNTLRKGYVLGLCATCDYPLDKVKEIQGICKGSVTAETKLLQLAYWMKTRYGATMIQCLKTVLPIKKKVKEQVYKTLECLVGQDELDKEIALCNPRVHSTRIRLLEGLKESNILPLDLVTEKLGVGISVVRTLEKRGVLQVVEQRKYRTPQVCRRENVLQHVLSEEQAFVVEDIERRRQLGFGVSLLHGITGSGKTEVYMEVIAKVLAEGKQAIVLIPEISLTFQTLMRFYERFGERVSVMHSRLSDGERYDQYERVKKGEIDIVIGPRSALFMPFPRLGILVIDEEHENSYKSEKMPKYHAREVAEYLAKRDDAHLLLGSATPSLESYYKAQQKEYELYQLKHRNGGATLPKIKLVDMREELQNGNKSFFSRELRENLTETLLKGKQAMIFINRRGYAGFVSCRQCGYVVKCPHCDVSLSQHGFYQGKETAQSRMVCHYCGYETMPLHVCPSCGSKYISGFRAGTERIEQELKKEYPSIRVLRMDADTTKKKDDYDRILTAFAGGEADVLVGTQMIVKGHDFPNVTLVGIVAADLSLFSSDFHSSERTFQLVVQACGRAGRGKTPGTVVLQTYQPEHYSLQHARKQDYEGFYEEELLYRNLGGYPPTAHLLAVQIFAKTEERADQVIHLLAEEVKKQKEKEEVFLIGPAKASISKLQDIYRMVLYLRHKELEVLLKMKNIIEERAKGVLLEEILQFDFDPVSML